MLPGSICRENIPAPFSWQGVSLSFSVESCAFLCKILAPVVAPSVLNQETNEREKERDDTRPGHNEARVFSVQWGDLRV
jgi:hypothetical protein